MPQSHPSHSWRPLARNFLRRAGWFALVSAGVALVSWWMLAIGMALLHIRQTRWELLLPLLATDAWFGASSGWWIPYYTLGGIGAMLAGMLVRPRLLL